MDDCCFICAENCTESYSFLINLSSKKYKTKFTTLIGDLINKEYELRVSEKNKICECCCVLLEKYDEMQQETKTIKSVLSRQLANTYNLETNQTLVYLDHSKFFVKLNSNTSTSSNDIKYSCKMCRFVTEKLDSVNSHCMYHKIITESKIQANDRFKDLRPTAKRNKPVHQNSNLQNIEEKFEVETELKCEQNFEVSEYDEETLETIIDLNLLEDEFYDSNLKNSKCMMNSCEEEFKFVADYVKHLKLKHKSSLNHIFAVVRANIRRPNKVSKLMCPYCFTKTPNNELLESHVKEAHEDAAKFKLFTDRINEFVSNLIKLTSFNESFNKDLKNKINCKYCTKSFYQSKLYHNHLAIDHKRCFVCFLTCKEKSLLRDHIISHTRFVNSCF
jgi:Zinc finger, C2H2 type